MNTCFFCDRRPADAAYRIEQPVYRLERYTHLGIARRFEYSKIVIPIERCAECGRRHRKQKRRRRTSIAIGAVTGFLIGLAIPGAFVFTAVAGGFLGHFAARARGKREYGATGLKGLDAASLSTHPIMRERLKSGWKVR